MKRILIFAISIISSYTASSQNVLSENREPSRATFMSYRSDIARSTTDKKLSENFSDLSGEWLCSDPASGISKVVTLPSANELSGFGQATYSDQAYPFLLEKPQGDFPTPTANQTLLFSRDFSIPFDYTDRMVYLHIGAANSSVAVYINGVNVGFSTDSRNPAEFNISKFVNRGLNKVELRVSRYSRGSYLEDQSAWRLTGLNREIYLFAQPKIRVQDFIVRTTLDPSFSNGLLETAMILKTELLNTHPVTIYYDLFDPQGKLVNQSSREITTSMRGVDTVRFSATILDVKKWNSETPNLYTIMYRVKREGRFTEYVGVKAGFRTVEVADQKLIINGKSVKIKGVNYAEFSPTTANVLTRAQIQDDIRKIKLAGLNAIRTDGYPLPADFYEICDQMGIYVCDVANVNAQGVGTSTSKGRSLANNTEWLDQFLYRVNNMYQRNKAHTCVIMWALGDNAGNGYTMYEAYMMLKAMDPTRPVIYNGAGSEFNTDITCPDTIDPTKKQQRLTTPILLSRTAYDPTIWERENYIGAFIDRWVSPSITASGAQFAELSNDYKLTAKSHGSMNMASAQDELSAITEQFRAVSIRVVDPKKRICEFENNLDFANLDELTITFSVYTDRWYKAKHEVKVSARPGEKVRVTLPKKLSAIFTSKVQAKVQIGNISEFEFDKNAK